MYLGMIPLKHKHDVVRGILNLCHEGKNPQPDKLEPIHDLLQAVSPVWRVDV
jgi:hypothetical protein